ncbi:Lrp/AsnC family transcriptional regulator [Pseudonocardia spinosispora]|uniref:Lrp/AsnC family transcriptional regulator n=1 Tax=Pseudonocardia spinosispora TaxID=103441 RepID=UPI000410EE21|nr:Lrp/AsnC family transcriptional regulator [Pseudonocardia spinosispora]
MKASISADSANLDESDRALVRALQGEGRASWSRLAATLDVSEQTVARRYRRLHTAGLLRVVGLPSSRRVGYTEWLFRIQCNPTTAPAVAVALAGREDVQWVHLLAGGTDIICFPRARSARERDDLLLEKLPRTGRVLQVTAQSILREFRPEEPASTTESPKPQLDQDDHRLLRALATDGRASYTTLATRIGKSETATRRKTEHLIETSNMIFEPEIDPALLGLDTEAVLWLAVAPAQLDHLGHAMSRHPGVEYVAATTGPTNLVAILHCRDTDALYDYLTNTLGAMPGVHNIETSPLIRNIKRRGFIMDGPRLLDPPPQN